MVRVLFSLLSFLSLCSLLSGQPLSLPLQLGINYGQIANNLPSPPQVAALLQSLGVTRVKLYDADPKVLSAFANTNIEFTISVGNDQIVNMTNPANAQSWLMQNVQPFLPQTRITCITMGNEVLAGSDTSLSSNLLPAMQALYQAMQSLGLAGRINVTTAHSAAILANSFPPSSGSFRPDLANKIQPLLNFLSEINSPFLINAYPFFAYMNDPNTVSLPYVLFGQNPGVVDNSTNLTYDNMLYAQIDAVYAAMQAMGRADVAVVVSETGWPSKGDEDEVGANVANAAMYNGNLLRRIAMGQGTPMRPETPVNVYVFALFNEDLKPGPTSERNYGLFYPDQRPVYDIGLQSSGGGYPQVVYSGEYDKLEGLTSWILILLAFVFLL